MMTSQQLAHEFFLGIRTAMNCPDVSVAEYEAVIAFKIEAAIQERLKQVASVLKLATEVCHWSGWARDAANHPGVPRAIFALKKAIEEMTGTEICEYN